MLVMVRSLLGDDALRKGLKYYFDHHKFGNANLDFSDANAQVEQTRKKVTTSVTAPFDGTISRYYQGSKNTASVTAVLDKGTKPDEVAKKILDKLKKQGSLRNQGTYQSFDSSFLTKGIGKVLSTITYFIRRWQVSHYLLPV